MPAKTTQELLDAAKRYRCIPKGSIKEVVIYLLCQWLKKKEPSPPLTCAAPVATAATNVASDSFSANWNSVTGATDYRLDVATDAGFTSYVAGYHDLDMGGPALTSLVTGLTGSTNYWYRVRAVCASGTSANSNVITVTTTVPQFSYSPANRTINWNDVNGGFSGNLAFFYANADIATTSFVDLGGQSITSISNASALPALATLNCPSNPFLTLDVSGCIALTHLDCSSSPFLTTLSVSGCSALTHLDCSGSAITTIDVSGCPVLTTVNCSSNLLDSANVSIVLCALDANGALNGTVDISNNDVPTAGGLVCSAHLDPAKGWTVTHD